MKKKKPVRKIAPVDRAALVAAYGYLESIWKADSDIHPLPKPEASQSYSEQLAELRRYSQHRGPDIGEIKTGIPALDRALPHVAAYIGEEEGGTETGAKTDRILSAVRLVREMISLYDDAKTGLTADFAKRKRSTEKAGKHLVEAVLALRKVPGADHLADLVSDLAVATSLAQAAKVRVRAINPETNKLVGARVRLTAFTSRGDTPFSPLLWHAKSSGLAGSDAKMAANGAAVRTLQDYIRADAPERFAIISGLLAVIGFGVSAPTVNKICKGYTPKSRRGY